MADKPFFGASLIATAPDGTYGGIRKSAFVAAFEDRLEINGVKIYYPYVLDVVVYGNVLHVAYGASDGKRVENFFRYNTFLAKTGARKLAEMADRVASARKRFAAASAWRPADAVAQTKPAVRAELAGERDGSHLVAVYSAMVAFPAVCPACAAPAEAVGRLPLSAGLDEKGSWLVPSCRAHSEGITQFLRIANWRAASSRLEFACARADYARYLVSLNSGQPDETVRRQSASAPLLFDIRNGTRFVVYQYAMSVIVMSFLRPSKIETIGQNESRFVRGLKYSGISLLAGWWGIPAGPIFTIASIVRNCRGGVDITAAVIEVLKGTAIAGGGY